MKKITLLLGVALIMGASAFACDGKKDGCCKGKKDKKEVAAKEHSCCKKGEGKTATANDVKKAPTKEAKTTTAVKKS
jgi:hypothetical protein